MTTMTMPLPRVDAGVRLAALLVALRIWWEEPKAFTPRARRRRAVLQERVARGMALLDTKLPGWDARIHLSSLEIASVTRCVLGQLYGSYGDGFAALRLYLGVGEPGSVEHGFMFQDSYEWRHLTGVWRAAILRRRAAQAA